MAVRQPVVRSGQSTLCGGHPLTLMVSTNGGNAPLTFRNTLTSFNCHCHMKETKQYFAIGKKKKDVLKASFRISRIFIVMRHCLKSVPNVELLRQSLIMYILQHHFRLVLVASLSNDDRPTCSFASKYHNSRIAKRQLHQVVPSHLQHYLLLSMYMSWADVLFSYCISLKVQGCITHRAIFVTNTCISITNILTNILSSYIGLP